MPALTFLVVDDNELQRKLAEVLLTRAGHKVMMSTSAADVSDTLAAHDASVVLLSASLPREEARKALTAALRARVGDGARRPPPVVVVGASPDERERADDLVGRGAAGAVVRPYDRARLAAQLELFSVGSAPATALVIDDSELTRRKTGAILARAGHQILEAPDGLRGLEMLARHPEIDLVLSDVIMPKLNGFQVCEAIRSNPALKGLPVLLLTSLDDIGSQSRAIEVGADDVLSKPISATELQVRVRSLLRLKSLQARLADRNDQLEQALQLRENLTHLIVHDFRNPLTRVMVSAEMLIEACSDAELAEGAEMAQDVLDGADRLRRLTDDLLNIARLEDGVAEPNLAEVDVAGLIDDIVAAMRRIAGAHEVTLVVEVDDVPRVRADREWIYRVLQNLVDNALKYSPRHGRITMRARRGEDGFVEVSVTDQGQGIPADHADRIFHKFAQIPKRSRRGSGLGLAFCRLAIEAHHGDIGVVNAGAEDSGAVFAFTLPAA